MHKHIKNSIDSKFKGYINTPPAAPADLHHFWIHTDRVEPYIRCWCSKTLILDYTRGFTRMTYRLNIFLDEHDRCVAPEQEEQAS